MLILNDVGIKHTRASFIVLNLSNSKKIIIPSSTLIIKLNKLLILNALVIVLR